MEKFKTDLKKELSVTYSDPEKVEAYFSSDDYTSCFWDFEDLESHTGDMCRAFSLEDSKWFYDEKTGEGYFYREPEGYGRFIKQDSGEYVMEHESTGKVTISVEEELYVDYCRKEEAA